MTAADQTPLSIAGLRKAYREGRDTPAGMLADIRARAGRYREDNTWIHLLDEAETRPYLEALSRRDPEELPLYGIPFAIKDNIDLAGIPTTAGCEGFRYTPGTSAFVVGRLLAAGAIPVGKANLDQFATGLVGTRSPWGATRNPVDPEYIAGGSSSGSAVAVARGLAAFALGTDTAGSGRVPAAFNHLVGVKPTRGLLSTRGVVPACRSLDCVSLFTRDCADAAGVLAVAAAFDPDDPWARPAQAAPAARAAFRFGVPRDEDLEFFGDAAAERLFAAAVDRLTALGGQAVRIDFRPFLDAAALLYAGPWVAERYAAIEAFMERGAPGMLPVTRGIIEPGGALRAVDAFKAQYRLRALKRLADGAWDTVDFICTPTAGTIYTIAAIEAEPVALNSRLGYYTNFMNLLDYAAIAVPAGRRGDGLPFGVTLFAPAFHDRALLDYAARFFPAGAPAGSAAAGPARGPREDGMIRLVVCGAHMQGLPLSHQLTERGARRVAATRTAACYRLYALAGGPPARPGLVRDEQQGAAIEVEVWELPLAELGGFVAGIPAPLGIGSVELADGSREKGFICEPYALAAARDITGYGGWRAWLAAADA